ncbi:MAG: hypothetical protein M0P26_06685 [Bacteroidales bacterium]|nr:hypothetical protein [Bacteroidales bacterium]
MKMTVFFISIFLIFSILQDSQGKENVGIPIKNTVDSTSVNAKDREILKKVAVLFIKQNKDYIKDVTKSKNIHEKECKRQIIVSVTEEEDYNGFKCYVICFDDNEIIDESLPSFLIKRNGSYITFYLKGQTVLSKQEIPKILFEKCEDEYRNEISWIVLVCKDSCRFLVINNQTPLSYRFIKQIQSFTCEKGLTLPSVLIEDAIIDFDKLNKE